MRNVYNFYNFRRAWGSAVSSDVVNMSMVWNGGVSVNTQQLDMAALLTAFLTFLLAGILVFCFFVNKRRRASPGIPPGAFAWDFIGEIFQFLGCYWKLSLRELYDNRTQKYGSPFTTSIFCEPTIVFYSPDGNRFLFANENKLVVSTWPRSVGKLFGTSLLNASGDDAKRLKRMLMTFLRPEALQKFVGRADSITRCHLAEHWIGRDEVMVFPLIKQYTFSLACDLFASINDEDDQARLLCNFMLLLKGMLQIPIDLPGTRFNRAKHGANAIREQLEDIIHERKIALEERKVSPEQDLLSFLLSNVDEQGESLTHDEIKDNILMLLIAGHDTTNSGLTGLIKFLAENPRCYQGVLNEQLEISATKEAGQLLEWGDLQRMKYSWRVAQEALRLQPPVGGGFRKAIKDFKYGGFTIPKGWKIHWTVNSTNRKSEYFSNPDKFDSSRFEGEGPSPYTFVPFGGGPRMCPGNEFARMVILVFLHYVVKTFKWNLVDPSEKVTVDPMPAPAKGLPVKLFPHD